ncbi:MAG TPA: hypothetical protein VG269_18665 [Tepidisphaeraceae bacterium]|jgi:hypothetical protein|nr:hypothetical protein [Tepidisphaeraceae bacterium]
MDGLENRGRATLELSAVVKAIGTDEFQDVLADALQQRGGDLPLSQAMENAGWWDADSVDVSVGDVTDAGSAVEARVNVYFVETHRSGCATINRTDSYRAELSVRLDKETGEAEISLVGHRSVTFDEDDYQNLSFDERAEFDYDRSEF